MKQLMGVLLPSFISGIWGDTIPAVEAEEKAKRFIDIIGRGVFMAPIPDRHHLFWQETDRGVKRRFYGDHRMKKRLRACDFAADMAERSADDGGRVAIFLEYMTAYAGSDDEMDSFATWNDEGTSVGFVSSVAGEALGDEDAKMHSISRNRNEYLALVLRLLLEEGETSWRATVERQGNVPNQILRACEAVGIMERVFPRIALEEGTVRARRAMGVLFQPLVSVLDVFSINEKERECSDTKMVESPISTIIGGMNISSEACALFLYVLAKYGQILFAQRGQEVSVMAFYDIFYMGVMDPLVVVQSFTAHDAMMAVVIRNFKSVFRWALRMLMKICKFFLGTPFAQEEDFPSSTECAVLLDFVKKAPSWKRAHRRKVQQSPRLVFMRAIDQKLVELGTKMSARVVQMQVFHTVLGVKNWVALSAPKNSAPILATDVAALQSELANMKCIHPTRVTPFYYSEALDCILMRVTSFEKKVITAMLLSSLVRIPEKKRMKGHRMQRCFICPTVHPIAEAIMGGTATECIGAVRALNQFVTARTMDSQVAPLCNEERWASMYRDLPFHVAAIAEGCGGEWRSKFEELARAAYTTSVFTAEHAGGAITASDQQSLQRFLRAYACVRAQHTVTTRVMTEVRSALCHAKTSAALDRIAWKNGPIYTQALAKMREFCERMDNEATYLVLNGGGDHLPGHLALWRTAHLMHLLIVTHPWGVIWSGSPRKWILDVDIKRRIPVTTIVHSARVVGGRIARAVFPVPFMEMRLSFEDDARIAAWGRAGDMVRVVIGMVEHLSTVRTTRRKEADLSLEWISPPVLAELRGKRGDYTIAGISEPLAKFGHLNTISLPPPQYTYSTVVRVGRWGDDGRIRALPFSAVSRHLVDVLEYHHIPVYARINLAATLEMIRGIEIV